MTEKMLRRCQDCAYLYQSLAGGGHRCRKTGFRFRTWTLEAGIPQDCPLEDAPRWVSVASGELPPNKASVPVVVAIPGDDREGPHSVLTSDACDAVAGEWGDWGDAVTHWLAGMPPLPKEASDAK